MKNEKILMEIEKIEKLANVFSNSGIYVKKVRQNGQYNTITMTKDELFVKMLKGLEIGFGITQSLDQINLVQGKLSLSEEGMRSLILKHYPNAFVGHKFIYKKYANGQKEPIGVIILIKRGDKTHKVSFLMKTAEKMGLKNRGYWTKDPELMMLKRATSKAARMYFADIINGLSYTPDEIEEFTENIQIPSFPKNNNLLLKSSEEKEEIDELDIFEKEDEDYENE